MRKWALRESDGLAAAGGVVLHGESTPHDAPPTPAKADPVQRLSKLKEMLQAGIITDGEYESKRAEIVSKI